MKKTIITLLAAGAAAASAWGAEQPREEYLQFLYEALPMPDSVDTSREFMLDNIDAALRARAEMPWGASVPEREFKHFVLPMRVNNEWLDGCRPVFYEELAPRVKNLSMKDAILEVNHWCHEKATYQPSDGRTHSPLMTVYTHLGRCGEESTFCVAALRSVGIPARQVYTPRWAHTDDNHAWVEAWADGRWYFLGACEPEPVLNLGWFNSAAARGILMNTRVMGADYDGPEEVLSRHDKYVDINVTANYAPTDTIFVEVVDDDGYPLPGAKVTFRLYNYGEFYPIASKTADDLGAANLVAGLGDLVVWASDPRTGRFGFRKVTVGKDRHVTMALTGATDGEWDIVPPVPGGSTPPVTPEQAAENERRKAYEDSLRTAVPFVHPVPAEFIAAAPDKAKAETLVNSLSRKDRTDVTMEVLQDHYNTPVSDSGLWAEWVLCPRVANEELTLWRVYLAEALAPVAADYRANPQLWADWLAANIEIVPDWYPSGLIISPNSVWETRRANARSRNTLFVAGARSMGIPARIDPVTGKTQWADADSRWHDVFTPAEAPAAVQGTLKLTYEPAGRIDDPKYYIHFSLSKIGADGMPQELEYPEEATWSQLFKDGTEVDAGQYVLVTGQRMASGTVLSRVQFIDVKPGGVTEAPMVIRQDNEGVQVIGSLNAENLYLSEGKTATSLLSTAGRGYYVVGLIKPNHEPSAHALNDLIAEAEGLEQWGRFIILLFDSEESMGRFAPERFKGLPSTVTFGVDTDGTIAAELAESLKLTEGELPVIVVADSFNRVVYVVQGYSIGLGHRLLDIIGKL